MPIFAHIDTESEVQINDKFRIDVAKTYITNNESGFSALAVRPGADEINYDVYDTDVRERFLDWEFLTWKQDIDTSNNKIDFKENGSPLVATLTTGTYTKGTLATEIATQLNAAGAVNYTVSFDEAEKLTISGDGAFDLVIDGPNRFTLLPLLSFFDEDSLTGRTSYTSFRVENFTRKIEVIAGENLYQEQTITALANTSHALNNKYFFISDALNATDYYVWFNSASTGTDPNISGFTGLEVAIANNDTATQVATAMAAVINAETGFSSTSNAAVVTVINTVYGWSTPAYDGISGFTFATITEGQVQVTDSLFVKLYTELGDYLFCSDQELEVEEPEIRKWVVNGRNSFKNIHRQVQKKILEWLDRKGYVNEFDEKFTKFDLVDVSEVREWSRYMALRIIFEGIKNQSDDVFQQKRNNYSASEVEARQRAILRIDADKTGTLEPGEGDDTNSIQLGFR